MKIKSFNNNFNIYINLKWMNNKQLQLPITLQN